MWRGSCRPSAENHCRVTLCTAFDSLSPRGRGRGERALTPSKYSESVPPHPVLLSLGEKGRSCSLGGSYSPGSSSVARSQTNDASWGLGSERVAMPNATIATKCCIAGGGPAGMMLGFLLARAGVDVVVLEKHADFFRDFRGDTVHPSTLELMYELGLLDAFLKVPHQKVERLSAQIGAERVPMADFTHLPTHCKFVALMPQWDFLNFLAERGKRYKTFDLRMNAEATDLIEAGGRVVGLRAKTPD